MHHEYKRLAPNEREDISRLLAGGVPQAEIARRLRRHPATVSREVRRNSGRSGYRAFSAERHLLRHPCRCLRFFSRLSRFNPSSSDSSRNSSTAFPSTNCRHHPSITSKTKRSNCNDFYPFTFYFYLYKVQITLGNLTFYPSLCAASLDFSGAGTRMISGA